MTLLDPLNPRNDQHLTSSNITHISSSKQVMRLSKLMILNKITILNWFTTKCVVARGGEKQQLDFKIPDKWKCHSTGSYLPHGYTAL